MKKRWIAMAVVVYCGAAVIGAEIASVVMSPGSSAAPVANAAPQAAPAAPVVAAAPAAAPANFRKIEWDALVPKDWDPQKRFQNADLNALSDSDPKAKKLLADLRAVWDSAPTVSALEGAAVKLPGYVVPLEEVDGKLKEFLLVPYFGACIHTPPPPANQIVHVITAKPEEGLHAMDTVWVSGTMQSVRSNSEMGVSGYRMAEATVEPYTAPKPQ
ncbi:DUF3299 domain-containing protein [Variovorax sp. PBL-E5]|uniref:DUF3299 domain-containing protein n=1 Tax=Variovorax sp. PBL-E5 TaxID=434014 RepID=UPI0013169C10|nr:DUF3299 domain-containing protein [Variovorax sp. PBL-E5]VTU28835.1 hypothetical protein E5CHR_02689 [Variovorax sp. PBL-E5]